MFQNDTNDDFDADEDDGEDDDYDDDHQGLNSLIPLSCDCWSL